MPLLPDTPPETPAPPAAPDPVRPQGPRDVTLPVPGAKVERPKDDPSKPGREQVADDELQTVYVVRDEAGKVIGRDVVRKPVPLNPREQEAADDRAALEAAVKNWPTLKAPEKDAVLLVALRQLLRG